MILTLGSEQVRKTQQHKGDIGQQLWRAGFIQNFSAAIAFGLSLSIFTILIFSWKELDYKSNKLSHNNWTL